MHFVSIQFSILGLSCATSAERFHTMKFQRICIILAMLVYPLHALLLNRPQSVPVLLKSTNKSIHTARTPHDSSILSLSQNLKDCGSQENLMDWQKWAFKSAPIFAILLVTTRFLVGVSDALSLILATAIVVALIITDGIKGVFIPMRDTVNEGVLKEVASEGLHGLGGKLGGGLCGLGTRVGGGFVIGVAILVTAIAYKHRDEQQRRQK